MPDGPGTNNGLLVISGQPGSGKSRLAPDLLAQLTNSGVRFVFFDMKGTINSEVRIPNDELNISVHPRSSVVEDWPINPLIRHQNPTENAQVAYEIANLICCFAPQLGAWS